MAGSADAPDRWSAGSIVLHWLMAAVIITAMTIGWIAEEMPRSLAKYELFVWHKSFGLLVLMLLLLRVLWRFRRTAPGMPAGHAVWEARAAAVSHGLLYLCMVAMPLSGWVINSAADVPLKWFSLLPVPSIAPADEGLERLAVLVHKSVLWVLLGVLAVHVAAALRHHFLLRDEVLKRMLPRLTREER